MNKQSLLNISMVKFIIASVMFLSFAGCNGASDGGSTSVNNSITQTANAISITLSSDAQIDSNSFTNSATISIQALLTDTFNNPIKSKIITFTSSLGTLDQASGLTDDAGIATIFLSTNSIQGAGAINANYSTIEGSYNFELLAANAPVIEPNKLSISLQSAGTPTNHFISGQTVQLAALFTNAQGQPIANQIVNFTVEKGLLTPSSALTSAQGMAEVTLNATIADIGAAVAIATITIDSVISTATLNYEILADESINKKIKVGYFNNNQFIEGELGLSLSADVNNNVTVSAGGTLGVFLALVDSNNNRITVPSEVTFTSNCVNSNQATIDTSAFTINGIANATFQDLSCSGSVETQDVIVASVDINNSTVVVSGIVNISAETVGSIEFVSATPTSIVLAGSGTGGDGKQEESTFVFKITGALGNALAEQQVNFSLTSNAGNVVLTSTTATTNSNGLVSTTIKSGNVPTVVRVTATILNADNVELTTQSDLLSVNTGIADQNSITISPESINIESHNINGQETPVHVWLADSFNNPVPDGTTVNFTTEGGNIEPSCSTINGTCAVTWTSSEPRVANHRVTVLATAVGHETFFDTNGNNIFDNDDGSAISDSDKTASGLERTPAQTSGFVDMSEAWRDDNENRSFDAGEVFIDFNSDQAFNGADGKFNGPQCQGSKCGTDIATTLNVRKAMILIMSSSNARYSLMSNQRFANNNNGVAHIASRWVYTDNDLNVNASGGALSIEEGESETLTLTFADLAEGFGQTLAVGTVVEVSIDVGDVTGVTNFTVPNTRGINSTTKYGGQSISFTITNSNDPDVAGDIDISGSVSFSITSQSGAITAGSYPITIEGS